MSFFYLMFRLLVMGENDCTAGFNLAESFTGNENYWNPALTCMKE
ncbi:hypothetical protein [Bacillus sp. J33]|nr:hypothetical protein [Bacillus sp. J33]